jgi:hypothetical protein
MQVGHELEQRLGDLERRGRPLEALRLRMRTTLSGGANSYCSTQVMVENLGVVVSKTPVDFFIRLTSTPNHASQFQSPAPADGTTTTSPVTGRRERADHAQWWVDRHPRLSLLAARSLPTARSRSTWSLWRNAPLCGSRIGHAEHTRNERIDPFPHKPAWRRSPADGLCGRRNKTDSHCCLAGARPLRTIHFCETLTPRLVARVQVTRT